jgi:UDP-glucose 4-epimerase
MRMILTGASGNLASHIASYFSGQKILLGRSNFPQIVDLLRDGDIVVHCAGALRMNGDNSISAYVRDNLLTTGLILDSIGNIKISKFINISSGAVYGSVEKTFEDGPCVPSSLNGLIKRSSEILVEDFCKTRSIPYINARVFNMYGGLDRYSIISNLIFSAHEGSVFNLINGGSLVRDFIHVDDVAKIIINLMSSDFIGAVNVGTGSACSVAELITYINSIGHKILISPCHISAIPESVVADTRRLLSLIDCDFPFVTIRDGILNLMKF